MLTSKVVYEGVTSVLESLKNSDLDSARKKLDSIAGQVKTERERGSLLAANGIYASMAKGKEGTMQTWDEARLARAAAIIKGSQMADEFDAGYAETLLSYSRLIQNRE